MPDKKKETSLRHSIVCAQGGVEFRAWHEHNSVGLHSVLSDQVSSRFSTIPDIIIASYTYLT